MTTDERFDKLFVCKGNTKYCKLSHEPMLKDGVTVKKLKNFIKEAVLERDLQINSIVEAVIKVMKQMTIDLPVGTPHQTPMEETIVKTYLFKIFNDGLQLRERVR